MILNTIVEVFNIVAVGFGTVAFVLGAVVRFHKNTLVPTKNRTFLIFYGLLSSNVQCVQNHFPFS